MDLIRRLIPFHLYFSHSASNLKYAKSDNTEGLAAFLYTFTVSHVILGVGFFYLSLDLFHLYTQEDGYVEYLTAFLLLFTSILCLYKALQQKNRLPKMFFLVSAFLLFFGFGEEISWAQRIIGFETPDNLGKVNAQQEFNLHNIHLSGVNLNKLIFGKILYTGIFIYFLAFPVFYRRNKWFSSFLDRFSVPLPSPLHSLLYMLCFSTALLIRNGEVWEIQEFILASFIFAVYLMPDNETVHRHA
ncbi:hypothetical protein H9Q13_14210 [Pontibacter sp. JH31]|uniref:Uncharacterized protein n=1 Tax=Pontibacter aquaedesilientis TaxID=2766980 RepID=A0ABR7XLM3_9BACT|nr:hypothetical protein [Pontibacter aquaedesilientis]MBD1398321.1 hypothetical protein [Pontibacter aquaedesilientis]